MCERRELVVCSTLNQIVLDIFIRVNLAAVNTHLFNIKKEKMIEPTFIDDETLPLISHGDDDEETSFTYPP